MVATIKQFERIFLISQAQRLGFFLPEAHDVSRHILPDGFVGLLPVEISLDAAQAPFRNMIIVQRRTIVVGTRKGDVHRATLCRRELHPSMRHHEHPTLTIGPSHALFRALSRFSDPICEGLCTPIEAINAGTCARRIRVPRRACRAGCIACAIMAGCCSSICAITTV